MLAGTLALAGYLMFGPRPVPEDTGYLVEFGCCFCGCEPAEPPPPLARHREALLACATDAPVAVEVSLVIVDDRAGFVSAASVRPDVARCVHDVLADRSFLWAEATAFVTTIELPRRGW